MHQIGTVTLEDLAGMVQQGFSDMGDRFEGLEGRFDGLEARVKRLEQELKDFRTTSENRFNDIEQQLERIHHRMPEFAFRFEVTELDRRVTLLEHEKRQ